MYSQNKEEEHIVNYFHSFKGNLLSIGENDGKTLSNSLRLIELGWKAVLVEPSKTAYEKLFNLHKDNDLVSLRNYAIGTENGECVFHESGAHFMDKSDHSLLSSIKEIDVKWKEAGVEFSDTKVKVLTYESFLEDSTHKVFDFITLDAEGMDVEILKQIDLTETKLLCVEWNQEEQTKQQILEHTSKFGMTNIIYTSPENLIIAR